VTSISLTMAMGLFFISGMAGLMYEVVWIRMMASAFGATVHAMAVVVSAFMAGLALGGWAFGRWIDRVRNPLRAYAWLEAGIALSALLVPLALKASEWIYVAVYAQFPNSPLVGVLSRFALSFVPLLVPTTLMGATLPAISKHIARRADRIGTDVGSLYSVNIVGAVGGAYLAGFILVGRYGLDRTVLLAAGLNILAGLLALGLDRFTQAPTPPSTLSLNQTRGEAPPLVWMAVFFLTGFASLAFQILWTKGLALFVDNTVYSYSAMLATFLAGLGVGGFVWSRFLRWENQLSFKLAVLQWGIGAWGALTVPLFHLVDRWRLGERWAMWAGEGAPFGLSYFATTVPVLFVPTFLMGVSFPLIVKMTVREWPVLGARLGNAYAVNTLGAIAGSLAAGFILLPLLGIQKSLLVVASLPVGIGMYLAWNQNEAPHARRWAGAAAGVFAVLAAWALAWEKPLILSTATFLQKNYGARDLLFYKEDSTAVVTVRRIKTGEKLLEINGKSVAGTAYEYENTQKMQAHLPLLLFGSPRSVLQVGFGSGGSLYSIARHRDVEEIHCVEICDSVMDAAPFFRDQNHDILSEPRLKIIHDDAVNYVKKMNRKYDLIMSDSIHPTYAGNGALYSVDYFQKCKEGLNPGGMMSFWFPLYSLSQDDYRLILRSFTAVFPHTSLWYVNTNVNPYTILVGSSEPFSIPVDRWGRGYSAPAVADDLRLIGIESPLDVLNCFLMAEEDVLNFAGRDGPLNTDRTPLIEFSVPRLRHIGREGSWMLNFRDVVQRRMPVTPRLVFGENTAADRPSMESALKVLYEATGPLLEGQLAQLNGARDAAMNLYQKSLAMNPQGRGAKTLLDYLFREKGERFRREKKWDAAIEQYQQALVYNPDSAKSHNNVATLYLAVGQGDEAERHFLRAIELDPTYVTPRLNLGFYYRDAGKSDQAEEEFQRAREIDPTHPAWGEVRVLP
jgi:spermidine synthase